MNTEKQVVYATAEERPLSPHLQIYKFTILMLTSILHRITGVFLALGMLVFVTWLLALYFGGGLHVIVDDLLHSYVGKAGLFLISWSYMFHMLGGVVYLFWDHGKCIDVKRATLAKTLVLVFSILFTAAFWCTVFFYAPPHLAV